MSVIGELKDHVGARLVATTWPTTPTVPAPNIAVQKLPHKDVAAKQWVTTPPPPQAAQLPLISVSHYVPEQSPERGGTNLEDDVYRTVTLAILIPKQLVIGEDEPHETWRQMMFRMFNKQRVPDGVLTGGTHSFTARVRYRTPVDMRAWLGSSLFLSVLDVQFRTRERRGIS